MDTGREGLKADLEEGKHELREHVTARRRESEAGEAAGLESEEQLQEEGEISQAGIDWRAFTLPHPAPTPPASQSPKTRRGLKREE